MNRSLKQYARGVYGQNAGGLILVSLAANAAALVTVLLPILLGEFLPAVWSGVINEGAALLLAPLGLGVVRAVYGAYLGEKPRFSQAFYYFTSGSRYGKALAVSVLISLFSYVTTQLSSAIDWVDTWGYRYSYRPEISALSLL